MPEGKRKGRPNVGQITDRNVLEKDIEEKLRKMVESHGGKCLKWVCPGWSGVPDRIVLLPGGRIIFVETKRPKGGKLSKMQEKWAEWLDGMDFMVTVAWSEADVWALEFVIKHMLTR